MLSGEQRIMVHVTPKASLLYCWCPQDREKAQHGAARGMELVKPVVRYQGQLVWIPKHRHPYTTMQHNAHGGRTIMI